LWLRIRPACRRCPTDEQLEDLERARVGQVPPEHFRRCLADVRALKVLQLLVCSGIDDTRDDFATTNVPSLVTGLCGLSRLRTLVLKLDMHRELRVRDTARPRGEVGGGRTGWRSSADPGGARQRAE